MPKPEKKENPQPKKENKPLFAESDFVDLNNLLLLAKKGVVLDPTNSDHDKSLIQIINFKGYFFSKMKKANGST